jgi:hypothetical protein
MATLPSVGETYSDSMKKITHLEDPKASKKLQQRVALIDSPP